ncbi:hypothetical protein V8C37DRAFT_375901 [Trichoderma ceciliae]
MPSTTDMSLIRQVRGVALTAPWLVYLLLPFRALAPKLIYKLSSRLSGSVWTWIQCIFEHINGAEIVCSGDDLPVGESAIVVSNHLAWSDLYMIYS